MSNEISRRKFVKASALVAASAPFASAFDTMGFSGDGKEERAVKLKWLENGNKRASTGLTWGVPWPQGRYSRSTSFDLKNKEGSSVPIQSWPLAYWPDGTLKWTAHAASENSMSTGELD